MKGLIIHSNWLDLILTGQKTWELRSRQTTIRGEIGLIRKGTGHVDGVANVTNVIGPLSENELIESSDRHCVPQSYWQPYEEFRWRYAWVLSEVRSLSTPVPYDHRVGAVIWVQLGAQCTSAIESVGSIADSNVSFGEVAVGPTKKPSPTSQLNGSNVFRWIEISQGNLNSSHFYLRSMNDWLPEDVIGGPNKASLAPKTMTIHWGGLEPVQTDVAGDKMIFRNRGWIGAFFRKNRLQPGDKVCFERIGNYEWRVLPETSHNRRTKSGQSEL